jgi:predicted nucleic-acid-binding protein
VKITADTNLLVRAIVEDDADQAGLARKELGEAELVALTRPALCELVWVLDSQYKVPRPEIAAALRRLFDVENVVFDRPSIDAGLAQLDAGGVLLMG